MSPASRSTSTSVAHAAVLLLGSCVPVLGALLIAPVLPQMRDAFADAPAVTALVGLALTFPALGLALLGPLAGAAVDRIGRTRLLYPAMLAFAAVGTAPLWLDSLAAIVASRALLGIVEAIIVTCCLTLIGDYFTGRQRDLYLSLYSTISAGAAVVVLAAGGLLGTAGWRTPFWGYTIALPLLVAMLLLLREPAVQPTSVNRPSAGPSLPWRSIVPLLFMTFLGGLLIFFVLQVQLGFVLDSHGASSAAIGLSAALANAGVMVSAALFVGAARYGASLMLTLGLVLGSAGVFVISMGGDWAFITLGAIISGLGCGLLLPALLIGTTAPLTFAHRGRGTAAWACVFALSQFLSPLAVVGLTAATGTLTQALRLCAVGGLATAAAAALFLKRRPIHTSGETVGAQRPD